MADTTLSGLTALAAITPANLLLYVVDLAEAEEANQSKKLLFTTLKSYTDGLYQPVGDYLIDAPSDGTIYGRQDGAWVEAGGGGAVDSVFGRTGAVVAASGDYTAAQVTNAAAGNIVAITVQAAVNELDSEKAGLTLANVFTQPQTIVASSGAPYFGVTRTGGKFAGLLAGTSGATFQFDKTGSFFIHAADTVNDATVDTARSFTITGEAFSASRFGLNNISPAALIDGTTKTTTNGSITDIVILSLQLVGSTAGAGFGNGVLLRGTSSTANDQNMARLTAEWATATHASRKARGKLTAYDTAERECIRFEASGTAAMVGFLGASAIVRQAHIADPSGGATQDAEARTAINAILTTLENFGFLATS